MAATPKKEVPTEETNTPNDLCGYFHKIASPTNSEQRVAFTLQGKRKSHRILCFSPEKIANIKESDPVKIINYSQSTKNEDIYMSYTSSIERVAQLDYECINRSEVTISMLPQLAIGDLLTFIAEVKNVKTPRSIKNHGEIQDISVSDTTGSVKVTLWQSFVKSCSKGRTYKFSNVRLMKDKYYGNYYLSTTKDEETMIELAADLQGTVPSIQLSNDIKTKGEFVAIDRIITYRTCILCRKKVGDVAVGKKSITCVSCGKSVKISACNQAFVMKANFLKTGTTTPISCTLFSEELASAMGITSDDLQKKSVTEIQDAIMDLDEVTIVLIKDNTVCSIEL